MSSPLPTASQLLTVWERSLSLTPVQRALALLALTVDGSAAGLGIGRRDRELLALRETLFGERLTASTACPACDEPVELNFSLADIRADFSPDPGQFHQVRQDDYTVDFRLPTCADLAAVPAHLDRAAQKSRLFQNCAVGIHRAGVPVTADQTPASLVDAVSERMSEIDPQGDVELTLDCPACNHHWTAPLDIASYLGSEIHAWAQRLLRDVHDLASAYGWSEAEIVALSPRRRQIYLDLLRP